MSEDQINDLNKIIGEMKKTLEEKIFNEEQQGGEIKSQAQKITELEALVNESKINSNSEALAKDEIKKKDNKIAGLVNKLEIMQKSLDEKAFLETQQTKTIESQAQKIAELKASVNESKVKNNDQLLAEEEIKKKNDQIARLVSKLDEVQKSLDEKAFTENQQTERIENQAQKIAELEVLVNESKIKMSKAIVKEESSLKDDSPDADPEEQIPPDENEEIFSKSKLIGSRSGNSFMQDSSFDHFKYSDIHIVNVNMTRATMDMASMFNKFLQEIISKERNKIIINLSHCEYIDSSILGVLVSSLKKAIALDGDLKIVWHEQNEYSMFSLTKMDTIFKIFPNLKDAVNSYSN